MKRVFSSSFVHICSVCERSPSSRFDNSWCAGERSLGLPTDGRHAGVSVRGGGRAGSGGCKARVASPAAGEVEPGHPAVEDEGDADEDALQSVDYGEDVAQNDHLARQNRQSVHNLLSDPRLHPHRTPDFLLLLRPTFETNESYILIARLIFFCR